MAVEGTAGLSLLIARVLFGGVLAFSGLNHFMNHDMLTEGAESKGVPAPGLLVYLSGALLVLGSLSVLAGVYPGLGALALVAFFVGVTPVMHDFWALSGEEQMTEMTNFLKNTALLGASLAFLALAGQQWSYAANLGMF